MLPRHFAPDFHAVRQLIEHHALQRRIVLDDEGDVAQRVPDLARPVDLQPFQPAVAFAEFLLRPFDSFFCQPRARRLVFAGTVQRCVQGFLLAHVPEPVDAQQVEGAEQLAVGRVAGVIGIQIAVVVEDRARHAVGGAVFVAVGRGGRLVDVGEMLVEEVLQGEVRVVERPDDAALFQRVFLPLALAVDERAFAGRGGQLRDIAPVGMLGEEGVRVEPAAVEALEYILAVAGRGGPVHELMGAVGAAVDAVDAIVGGEVAGDGEVFLRGDVALKRGDDAVAGRVRRVAVGGVDHGGIAVEHAVAVEESGVGLVHVVGEHGAALDRRGFAPAVFQPAADKAALVLDAVALLPGQAGIFLGGLWRADGVLEPLAQGVKGNELIRPDLRRTAAAVGDLEFTHWTLPPPFPR